MDQNFEKISDSNLVIPICRNCKWYYGDFTVTDWRQKRCNNPALWIPNTVNVVIGGYQVREEYCHMVRFDSRLCGHEGKWYEPSDSWVYNQQLTPTTVETRKPAPGNSSKKRLEDYM